MTYFLMPNKYYSKFVKAICDSFTWRYILQKPTLNLLPPNPWRDIQIGSFISEIFYNLKLMFLSGSNGIPVLPGQ